MHILTNGLRKQASLSNKSSMIMNRNIFVRSGESLYEAPAVAVLDIENEGAICSASTQYFEEETDWNW